MHGENVSFAYGFWSLVIINVGLFIFFILSFLSPVKKREWRSMGVTTAFLVALFTEMYGFPLTIYILTAWLGNKYPVLNPFSHSSGHLWLTFLGGGPAMMAWIHIISNGFVIVGFIVMSSAWQRIHSAKGGLVTDGPYRYVRHPQYSGLFLIMIGLLIQWPTIITLFMSPVLFYMYYRLSRQEEAEVEKQFGDLYRRYKEKTPRFVPRLSGERPQEIS